jgi:hypothetical protein
MEGKDESRSVGGGNSNTSKSTYLEPVPKSAKDLKPARVSSFRFTTVRFAAVTPTSVGTFATTALSKSSAIVLVRLYNISRKTLLVFTIEIIKIMVVGFVSAAIGKIQLRGARCFCG